MFPKPDNHGKARIIGQRLLQFSYLDSRSRGIMDIKPILSPERIVSLVRERIERFQAAPPGVRESDRSRRDRKYIAAHPIQILRRAWNLMDDHEKMELDMMLSPSSHHGISDPSWVSKNQRPTEKVLGDDRQEL